MNNLRAIFSEWQVAVLLDLPLEDRDAWAPYDFRSRAGFTFEVQSAAYLQEWSGSSVSKNIQDTWKGFVFINRVFATNTG